MDFQQCNGTKKHIIPMTGEKEPRKGVYQEAYLRRGQGRPVFSRFCSNLLLVANSGNLTLRVSKGIYWLAYHGSLSLKMHFLANQASRYTCLV